MPLPTVPGVYINVDVSNPPRDESLEARLRRELNEFEGAPMTADLMNMVQDRIAMVLRDEERRREAYPMRYATYRDLGEPVALTRKLYEDAMRSINEATMMRLSDFSDAYRYMFPGFEPEPLPPAPKAKPLSRFAVLDLEDDK